MITHFMETPVLTVIDISGKTAEISDIYKNIPLALINDHVIRVSVMNTAILLTFTSKF